jgi:NTP pyrophosphatase (non-canonical NTP hydrolase)
MKINATEQTSTFPHPINELKDALNKHNGMIWETQFGTFKLTDNNIKWILSNVQVSMYNPNRSYIYNKAFYENCIKETVKKCNKKPLKMFQQIRDWAEERGLYNSGNTATQYVKLQEECGELAKALLKDDQPEVIDAIGDIVVVLTNLAHQRGTHIETCISSAYNEIKGRTGQMINGTFVKDEN